MQVCTDDKKGRNTESLINTTSQYSTHGQSRSKPKVCPMQEDLVTKLSVFGFTVNQAKVYLSIAQSGKTSVGKIARTTQLHRQDIYKLLPKLEKMGLITKTIDKPFMIEAIPIDRALETYITIEREKAYQRISLLENNLKELVNEIQMQPESKEEAKFTLLTTDEAIRNKGRLIFKRTRREFQLVATVEQINYPSLRYFHDYLQAIADNHAKIKILVVTAEDLNIVKQTMEKVAPTHGQFTAKCINKNSCKNYQLIDNKEVWIAAQQRTHTGYPCILWTNDQNIVDAYKGIFRKAWTHPKTQTVYDNIAKAFMPQVTDETVMPRST